jgi:hypothetical protein
MKPKSSWIINIPPPPFGPEYPKDLGPNVAKFRRMASDGIAGMDHALRKAYGEAVEAAIKSKQRSDLLREGTAPPPLVKDVGAYLRAKQRSALLACPGAERRARTSDEWQRLYEEAMNAKRNGPTDVPDNGRRISKGSGAGKALRSATGVHAPSRRRSRG